MSKLQISDLSKTADDFAADVARLAGQRDELRALIADLESSVGGSAHDVRNVRDVLRIRGELLAARQILDDVQLALRRAKLDELLRSAQEARNEAVRLHGAVATARAAIEPQFAVVAAVIQGNTGYLAGMTPADIERAVDAWAAWLPEAVRMARLSFDAHIVTNRAAMLDDRARALANPRESIAGMFFSDDPVLAELLAADREWQGLTKPGIEPADADEAPALPVQITVEPGVPLDIDADADAELEFES